MADWDGVGVMLYICVVLFPGRIAVGNSGGWRWSRWWRVVGRLVVEMVLGLHEGQGGVCVM